MTNFSNVAFVILNGGIDLSVGALIAIYQSQIDSTLARKNNDAHEETVGLLRRIRVLMRRLGRNQEFTQYLEDRFPSA